jgi:hypothetical protein
VSVAMRPLSVRVRPSFSICSTVGWMLSGEGVP